MKNVPFVPRYHKKLDDQISFLKQSKGKKIFDLSFVSVFFGGGLCMEYPLDFILNWDTIWLWWGTLFLVVSWIRTPFHINRVLKQIRLIELDIKEERAVRFVSYITKKCIGTDESEVVYTIVPQKIRHQLGNRYYVVTEKIYEEIRKDMPYYVTVSRNSLSFLDIHSMN